MIEEKINVEEEFRAGLETLDDIQILESTSCKVYVLAKYLNNSIMMLEYERGNN